MSDGRWLRWVIFGGLALAVVVVAAQVVLDDSRHDDASVTVAEGGGASPRPTTLLVDESESSDAPLVTAMEPQLLDAEGEEAPALDMATFRGMVAAETPDDALAGATVWHVPDATTLTAMGFDVDVFARLDGGIEEILPVEHMTSTVTRKDGTFEFRAPSLPSGGGRRWPDVPMLVISHPEMATRPLRCSGFRGGLDASYDAGTIVLDYGATITGWIGTKTDTDSALAVADARVSVWSSSWADVWSSAVDISRWGWLDFRRDFFHFFETRTNADGSFELPGVVSGLIAMEVEADDYATWRAPGVYLKRGEEHRYADVLLDAGRILDILVVDDESKTPIPGATVTLLDPADFSGWHVADGSRVVARKTTDASGRVMFTGLGSELLAGVVEVTGHGSYVVGAVVARERSSPKTLTWSVTRNLRVVDIYSSIAPVKFSDFDIDAWGIWHEGDGAIEHVQKLSVLEQAAESGGPLGALIDDWGAATIVVRSSRAGYVPTFKTVQSDDDAVFLSASTRRSIHGVVVDEDGVGVADALVRASPQKHWESERPKAMSLKVKKRVPRPWDAVTTAWTAADGSFTVEAPAAGACTVFATSAVGAVKETVTVDLRRESEPEPVRLTLAPMGAIEGTLIDALGRPVAGASIEIDGPDSRETLTEEDGSFAFASVLPGYYRVTGHLAAGADCSVSPGTTQTLKMIALARPVLRGQVRKNMQAVPYARVTAWWGDGDELSIVTDVLGFFEVVLPRKGTLHVVAQSREGSLSEIERLTLLWGESYDVSLEFGSRTLHGSCAGGNIDDARVAFVRFTESALVVRQVIDEDGLFVFEDLPRGPVEVGVESNGFVLARRSLERATGHLEPFDLGDEP